MITSLLVNETELLVGHPSKGAFRTDNMSGLCARAEGINEQKRENLKSEKRRQPKMESTEITNV